MVTRLDELLGNLAFDNEGVAETRVELSGREVEVDVNFESAIPEKLPTSITQFVAELNRFDAIARATLTATHETAPEGAAALYVTHHRSEIPPDALEVHFGRPLEELDAHAFLGGLHLERVGLYPDAPNATAVFDYTLGRALTDYVLAVTFDRDGASSRLRWKVEPVAGSVPALDQALVAGKGRFHPAHARSERLGARGLEALELGFDFEEEAGGDSRFGERRRDRLR
jgi:hypothetical protein